MGVVTLVGAGPGDRWSPSPDVTRSPRPTSSSPTAVPRSALEWAEPDAEIIDVAKVPGGRSTDQGEINRLLIEHAKAGNDVVRFKGGDSFVGRGGEELLACADAGIEARVIPGVSSATAVPAVAGIPVTQRGPTQAFTVVSGHVPPGHPDSTVDWAALARSGSTLVVMMEARTLGDITEALVSAGMDPTTPAAVIADGAMPSQRVVRSDLAAWPSLPRRLASPRPPSR